MRQSRAIKGQRKKGAIFGYVNIAVKNLVSLVYTPLLLHYIGNAEYGVYQTTFSLIFSLSLLSMGFTEAYVRFYMRFKESREQSNDYIKKLNGLYLVTYFVIALMAMIIGIAMAFRAEFFFSKQFSYNEIELARILMIIMSVNIGVTFLSTPFDAFIMVHEEFVFQQTRQLFTQIAQPVLAVVLLEVGFGAVGVAGAQLILTVILLLLNIRFSLKKLGMEFAFWPYDGKLLKGILVFSFWVLLSQIFDLINNQVPNYLLAAMTTATIVATFAISLQIRSIFISLSVTMSNVFIPKINNIVACSDDNEILTKLMTKVGRYQSLLFIYVYGGFLIVGRYFVDIWAGDTNQAAYGLAAAMTLPLFIPLIQNTGIEIQRAKNRHKMRSLIYLFTALLDIAVSVILIPRYGYWATAIGYILSILIGPGLFMNWYYHRRLGIDMKFFWKCQFPSIVNGIVIIGIGMLLTYFVPVQNPITFIGYSIIYSLIYFVSIYFFVLNKQEKDVFVRFFRGRKTIK